DAIYNKIFMPPKTEGICDKCGSELFQRADDSLETAKSRLAVFHKQTQPLIDYYEKLGLLYSCKSTDLDEIVAELATVLE
ncbi:MAG: adenylate kinase, partial [Lentisphaeria bacterium]|nr:adenylate kinase [Lentisphaeria bacterium]